MSTRWAVLSQVLIGDSPEKNGMNTKIGFTGVISPVKSVELALNAI